MLFAEDVLAGTKAEVNIDKASATHMCPKWKPNFGTDGSVILMPGLSRKEMTYHFECTHVKRVRSKVIKCIMAGDYDPAFPNGSAYEIPVDETRNATKGDY